MNKNFKIILVVIIVVVLSLVGFFAWKNLKLLNYKLKKRSMK